MQVMVMRQNRHVYEAIQGYIARGRTMKIFLIDDDAIYAEFLLVSLRKASTGQDGDRNIRHFLNAEDALAAASSEQPLIYICDYRLPGMSGMDFFERVKNQMPEGGKFVMVSALDDGMQVLDFIQRGLRDYVIKDDHVIASLNAIIDNRDEELFY